MKLQTNLPIFDGVFPKSLWLCVICKPSKEVVLQENSWILLYSRWSCHTALYLLKLCRKCFCRFCCTLDSFNKELLFVSFFFFSKDDLLWSPNLLPFFFSDGEGKKRTSTVCSSESLNAVGATLTPRRISWRQRIFLRVASPMNKSPSKMQRPGLCGLLNEQTVDTE